MLEHCPRHCNSLGPMPVLRPSGPLYAGSAFGARNRATRWASATAASPTHPVLCARSRSRPSATLLGNIRPHEAEYWDNSGLSGLKFALQYAKSYVTGKEMRPGDETVDQHAQVKM